MADRKTLKAIARAEVARNPALAAIYKDILAADSGDEAPGTKKAAEPRQPAQPLARAPEHSWVPQWQPAPQQQPLQQPQMQLRRQQQQQQQQQPRQVQTQAKAPTKEAVAPGGRVTPVQARPQQLPPQRPPSGGDLQDDDASVPSLASLLADLDVSDAPPTKDQRAEPRVHDRRQVVAKAAPASSNLMVGSRSGHTVVTEDPDAVPSLAELLKSIEEDEAKEDRELFFQLGAPSELALASQTRLPSKEELEVRAETIMRAGKFSYGNIDSFGKEILAHIQKSSGKASP